MIKTLLGAFNTLSVQNKEVLVAFIITLIIVAIISISISCRDSRELNSRYEICLIENSSSIQNQDLKKYCKNKAYLDMISAANAPRKEKRGFRSATAGR